MKKNSTSKNASDKKASSAIRHASYQVDDNVTDAFIQEVNEDVKNDNLKKLWDKYGLFIVLFVVIAVSAAVSFETIKGWRDTKYQTQTENYLLAVQPAENYENSLKALEKIAAADNGIYSDLARVQIATLLFEQGKNSEAETMLQTIADNDELNQRIRNLAALKLATYKIDTAPRAEIEALLKPVVAADDSWSPLATDLLAMAAIRDGDTETARSLYTALLENGNISDNFKSRIQDMLSTLNGL